ncbi:heavy metal translocating P-type ATPase [Campylobacter hyointestinalis]|uniref:heavy metal translocating P-type ATPase n=1 Tax=Campylobacter hyointestinalis TaxID=198 RepID=UPI00072826DF|nr:heavy metal translocating P-type ATPase [Campylobacter hyointestinalis]PPB56055.1 heavy metal translocating P-type ATPase [Campylobacter hyointestinalis subsp. hyointestinalis]PPB69760.1 heavy metal translocating P-type ATPase [Campylobacter hyointestinalis subsp. hyointestinalis]CUU70717.1 metal transporting atpase Mta72 [Campylobacter hyointestinalis subsp. hyointestinalis]CUU74956.1 metal transporting atpase Mta72 [Campylobacter hyointestinalis subsp. hyointestinalis]CUU75012.1 metal tra
MQRISIASKIGNRIRFICDDLNRLSDERGLEADILKFDEITNVRVNKAAKSIIVTHNSSLNALLKRLQSIEIKKLKNKKEEPSKAEIYKSIAILALSALNNNAKFNKLASLYGSINLLKAGSYELFSEGLTSKTLEALAVGVSLARGDYGAANGTNLLLNLGEYIEESTVHKSDDLIKELAKPSIKEAWIEIKKDGKNELVLVNTNDIKKGDIVVVSTGESIAIDGYIVEGSASINQVSMTGEAQPVKKERGDLVMSGTIVEEGRIKIWAELIGDETTTNRIKKYIQSSLNEKSNIGLKATKLANKLVPVTLGLAGLSYLINKNTMSMASVLQADYSCALKLATPVAFKTSISRCGRDGILIKGAKAIEALSAADTFVFDKTGTLTYGNLSVSEIYSFDENISPNELLNLSASAEEHYFHPVAEAIVKAARQRGFHHIHHEEVEFIVAHGVKTTVKGKEVIIGSRHFLEDDEMVDFRAHKDRLDVLENSGPALLYIAYDKKLIGVIALKDEIRANAKDCISKLKEYGVKEIIMLSGDIKSKAEEVAKNLGIDRVFANCLPTDKAKIIENLRNSGKKVAFIGDGINDAPSLVKANVGISMSKGADIAKASADISLLKDDICSVAKVKLIANKTMDKINTNFKATVGINSAILLGATLGKLNPIQTAVLHNGTTIALLLNSLNTRNTNAR